MVTSEPVHISLVEDDAKLTALVKEYLELEGLESSTGLPSREVLENLDLARYLD